MKHIVGFSGGIDSQAAATWVLNRHPREDVILLNSNAGKNEHPVTTEFIQWFSQNVHPVITVTPIVADNWKTPGFAETRGLNGAEALTFKRMIEIQGRPPAGKAQFCTEIVKLRPSLRWIRENVHEPFERYTGMRRQEGGKRQVIQPNGYDDFFECPMHHPIFDWTKEMCFAYCKAYHQEINPLYTMGFSRVGCWPCSANASREDVRNWAKRDPENVIAARQWELKSGITFFPPIVPGKHRNTVDEVVAWANCERGGKQFSLDVFTPSPACESKYGLCE